MSKEIFATMVGAMVSISAIWFGSYLNKKQRVREELYSYKVKAYAALAQLIAEIRQDYVALLYDGTGSDVAPFDDFRSPLQIDEYFRKNLYINILFLSPNTKAHIEDLCNKIFESSKLTFNRSIMPEYFSNEMLIESYQNMIDECDLSINKLYEEIGLNKF